MAHSFVPSVLLFTFFVCISGVKSPQLLKTERSEEESDWLVVPAPEVEPEGRRAFLHAQREQVQEESLLSTIASIPGRVYNQIAVNVTYNGLIEEFYTFPERRPRAFNIVMATVKTWLADFIVQIGEGRLAGPVWNIDWKRSAAFASFGCFYVGMVQWILYVTLFTALCPNAIRFANLPFNAKLHDLAGQKDLVRQVCYDNFLLETLIYFPVFYMIREVVNGTPSADSKPSGGKQLNTFGGTLFRGLSKYAQNFKQDNLASWAVWVPADVIVYAVPMYLRMPVDHLVSFGWTMLLSHMRGSQH